MKAQTSRTPEISTSEQVTPVIVKIGGGDAITDSVITDSDNPMTINIDSPLMEFTDKTGDETGDTWKEAESTSSGRIHELSIHDGGLKRTDCKVLPQPDVLTSLELRFETGTFEVSEQKKDNKYFLKVQSSRDFHIQSSTPVLGWNESEATFPIPQGIVFKQNPAAGGDDILRFEYNFNNPSQINFSLDFHVDPVQ
jgi:hypothetical protein